MVKLFNQISLSDIYQECKDTFQNDKPKFLELLTKHIDLSSLVPPSFYWSYYKVLGRDRKYSLLSMLAALILQKILGIPTVSLLILFLVLCREAREFCGFTDVPDNAQFTRFKQDFIIEIEAFFNHLVDVTEPLCQKIDSKLASTLAFDTSGIEAYVTENKMYPGIIRDTEEWIKVYKFRCVVEQNIQYFKEPMGAGNPKTRDRLTIKADLLLAGIAQLLTVILACQAGILQKPEASYCIIFFPCLNSSAAIIDVSLFPHAHFFVLPNLFSSYPLVDILI